MFHVKSEETQAISGDWHVKNRNFCDEPQIFKNCFFQIHQAAIAINHFCKIKVWETSIPEFGFAAIEGHRRVSREKAKIQILTQYLTSNAVL